MKKQPILRELQRGTRYLLDTVFPPHCVGCERSGAALCSSCIAQFKPVPPLSCPACGNTALEAGMVCNKCRYTPPGLNGLFAVCMYEEPLRSCIHALKYDGNLRLAEPLGTLLGQSFNRYGLQADAIIPVPLHKDRQHQRGYNQAQLLAEIWLWHSFGELMNL